MKKLILILTCSLLTIGAFAQKQPYKVTKNKVIAWGLFTIGGGAWGVHEAYYADPNVLEDKFGFSDTSWGGSNAWENKYPGGDYQEGEKPVWFKDKTNVFRDVKKTSAYLGRQLPIIAGINITLDKNRNWKDYVIGMLLYSGTASLTYNYLRR